MSKEEVTPMVRNTRNREKRERNTRGEGMNRIKLLFDGRKRRCWCLKEYKKMSMSKYGGRRILSLGEVGLWRKGLNLGIEKERGKNTVSMCWLITRSVK